MGITGFIVEGSATGRIPAGILVAELMDDVGSVFFALRSWRKLRASITAVPTNKRAATIKAIQGRKPADLYASVCWRLVGCGDTVSPARDDMVRRGSCDGCVESCESEL